MPARPDRVQRVNLESADFSGATLRQAEILDSRAPRTDFSETELAGTRFRRTDLGRSEMSKAIRYRTQILECTGLAEAALVPSLPRSGGVCLTTATGHQVSVTSCAFSPDGARIVSAGSDPTVRVWDAESGEELSFNCHHLPGGESATLLSDGSGAVGVSPGAWRWLSWRFVNAETCMADALPAEAFGPLPNYPLHSISSPPAPYQR